MPLIPKLQNAYIFFKKHSDLIALICLCIGIFCYGIGLGKLAKNFQAQSFILIGGVIFVIFNFKKFGKDDLKILAIPLICIGILLFLALLTYFDSTLPPKSFSALVKTINSNLLGYFVFFVICFLFCRYAKRQFAYIPLYCFAFMCVINVVAMVFLALQNGFYHESFKQNVPFFFRSITQYNVWIPLPLAVSLAGIFVYKQMKLRLLFVCCLVASIIAMLANGERSFFLAFGVMIFIPFLIYRYSYKKYILVALALISAVAFYAILHFSKDLPPRYNAHNIISNLGIVWHTTPIEMGKYDKLCFESKWLECTEESLRERSDISIEHSTLSRLNMTKSTLLAFLDSPLMPRVPDVLQTGEYIYKYYQQHNPQNGSYIKSMERGKRGTMLYYNHTHNFIAGLLLCYGIVGFGAIIVSMCYLLFIAYKATRTADLRVNLVGLSAIIFFVGLCVNISFDALLTMMLQTIFILLGFITGFLTRSDNAR